MKTTYREDISAKDRKYLVLHSDGNKYRVLKVTEDKESALVKFYLFGGIEMDCTTSQVQTKEDNDFINFIL